MSATFYLSTECNTCGKDMYYGLVTTTEERRGYPVINCDTVSQISFRCDNCHGVTYTGDFEDGCIHEQGVLPEDDEDEEAQR